MKRVTVLFALLLILGVIPTLAQNTVMYEDPVGRFSVPIPAGWMDESTAEVGRFVSPDDIVVSILAVEAADAQAGDQAILTAILPDLVGTDPVQTTTQPGMNGTWAANIFVSASGRFIVLATQWIDGLTYGLVFDLPTQDALAANGEQLVSMFKGFSIGKRLDLTGVKAKPFTAEMLSEFKAYVENARKRFHVPGASIAIVQNGDVVHAGGFGMTDQDGGQPVTADTLFMIGSVTKSMTTMMMGTLVDEGILDWDQLVTKILPSFALSDSDATAQIRLRDLVNMSSGVPAYDTIFSFAKLTPQEVIASLAEIPMVAAPGKMWNYNNQMFATGGYLSALAAGSATDGLYEGYIKLVQERVFDPIGMANTTFNFAAATSNLNHALPFAYNPLTQSYIIVPLDSEHFGDAATPAAAVWSNAEDMARYLQTELSGGLSPNGERVISEATLHTTQSPEIAGFYGMGWFTDSYFGLPLIWHGGNMGGFTSDLAFLPSANIGVVILSNAWEAGHFTKSVREYAFQLAYGLEHDSVEHYAVEQAAQDQAVVNILTNLPDTPVDSVTVAPYAGVYAHGISVEMRGDELWLVGAFAQASLHPAGDIPGTDAGDYIGNVRLNPLRVRFIETDGQVTLEITNLSSGETLTFDKVQ